MMWQGFSTEAIAQFAVYIQVCSSSPEKKDWSGEFRAPDSAYLYTHGDSAEEVNNTIFHEVRHYWQLLQHLMKYRQLLEKYEQIKDKRARKAFYHAHVLPGALLPSEAHLAYKDRPSEIDAKAFAAEHAPRCQLIVRQQVYRVSLPVTVVQTCEAPIRAWLKRLGCSLVFDGEHAQAQDLTREDVERLMRYLQAQSGRRVRIAEQ